MLLAEACDTALEQGVDYFAVDIELQLLGGIVADAHRSRATVTRKKASARPTRRDGARRPDRT
jgi:hypothetical protein